MAVGSRSFAGKFALVCLAIIGCNSQPRPDYQSLGLVDVTGVVRLDGSPLAKAIVRFCNEDGTFSSAVCDESGRFRLNYNSEQSGIVVGKKKVRISTLAVADEDARGEEKLPARYNSKSELTADVSTGNCYFEFNLDSHANAEHAAAKPR